MTLDELPDDLLREIVRRALDQDIASLFSLSCVSRALKTLVERAAHARTSLGGDASSAILRRQPASSALLEPAVPLKRLLYCVPLLHTLDLSGANWCLGSLAALQAVNACPAASGLQVLRLDYCEWMEDPDLIALLIARGTAAVATDGWSLAMEAQNEGGGGGEDRMEPAFPWLHELSLRSCRRLTSAFFLEVFPYLQRLDVAWCIEMKQIDWFVDKARRLAYLDVTGIESFDDGVATMLPDGVRELRLAMTGVSDIALGELAHRPQLERLVLGKKADNLWTTGHWTEAGLAEFRRRRSDVAVDFVSA